jgi:hypothetical protein
MDNNRGSSLHEPPQAWREALARAEADLAAGNVVDLHLDALCLEIEAEADAMEAGRQEPGADRGLTIDPPAEASYVMTSRAACSPG